MTDTSADARSENGKTDSRWVGLYFGLGVQVVTRVLGYWLLLPIAFGLAMFLLNLFAYPMFFRGKPRGLRWMVNWGFREFVLFSAAVAVVCAAFLYAFLKILDIPSNFYF